MGNKTNHNQSAPMSVTQALSAMALLLPALAVMPGCGDYVLPGGSGLDTGSVSGDKTDDPGTNDTDGTGGSTPGGGDTDGGDGSSETPSNACADEEAWALEFLDDTCAGCHSPGYAGSNGNFDYVTNVAALVAQGQVIFGAPDESPLLLRVENGSMPPSGEQPGAETVARLRNWIAECAPTEGDCGNNEFIDTRTMLREMTRDLNGIDNDDRETTRYFTFVHLHNAGFCDAQIQPYRDALFKLVNALSSEVRITRPEAIDDNNLIYRIDLEDYGWDENTEVDGFGFFNNKWDAIIEVMDYSVEFLEDEADDLKDDAETNVPFVMGDAFVEEASQPPLYHAMANVPDTLQELELLLGIDIDANIEDEDVIRAGVLNSGVSQQNRIVERHEIPTAFGQSVWVSYDFADDSQTEQNIFSSPLDFQEAGGEVIYSLPNGMHAYMLTEADGTRIDVAPDFIVNDPQQKDQNVRNGVSCFSCHQSFLPAEDDVRESVLNSAEFNINEKDEVANLYVPRDEFQEVLDQDTQTFHNSLKAAGVRADYEREPILFTFLNFDQNVTLERAAAELNMPTTALLSQLGRLDPSIQQLATGPIKRQVWQQRYAETVCLLSLGLADDEECGISDEDN